MVLRKGEQFFGHAPAKVEVAKVAGILAIGEFSEMAKELAIGGN